MKFGTRETSDILKSKLEGIYRTRHRKGTSFNFRNIIMGLGLFLVYWLPFQSHRHSRKLISYSKGYLIFGSRTLASDLKVKRDS